MAFRLNCVSELYKNLGRHDAIVEFTEISIRDFIDQANQTGNFDQYLQAKSAQHDICVNTIDQEIYRSRISQSYVLSVYQTAELFLHQFRNEHIQLFNEPWRLDDTSDSILIKTIRQISPVNPATEHIGEFRLAVFNYCRVVRNKYSHDVINESRVDREFDNVNQHREDIALAYEGLNAPNNFDTISFDDFILFSRVVKDIADKLNELITPDNEVIVAYYRREDLFTELNENVKRKKNALKGHMRTKFGLDNSHSDTIINMFH